MGILLRQQFNQQLEMVTDIAYPKKAKPGMHQGVVFFSRMRGLIATGFYTSEIGIKDIGYVGNVPGQWTGSSRRGVTTVQPYGCEDLKKDLGSCPRWSAQHKDR